MLIAEVTDTPVWVLAFATIALSIAAWIALLSLRDARKTRIGQVLAELSRRWDDPYVYDSLQLFRRYRQAGTVALINDLWDKDVENPDLKKLRDWHKISVWPNLIETIGVFWAEKIFSERVIYKMWAGTIIEAWDEWRIPTKRLRELSDDPRLWQNFQNLAEAMEVFQEKVARRTGRFWIDSPGCIALGATRACSGDSRSESASPAVEAAADHTSASSSASDEA